MKITNILGRSNSPVKNQFIIYDGSKVYFQSYSTLIAVFDSKAKTLRVNERYINEKGSCKIYDCHIATATTRKYFDIFTRNYCKGWQGDFKFLSKIDDIKGESFAYQCAQKMKPTSHYYGY